MQAEEGRVGQIRAKLAQLEKEISEAAVTAASLRENMRFRRLQRECAAVEAELSAIDMEEAAKAKRIWTEKWAVEKQKENDLQKKVRCRPSSSSEVRCCQLTIVDGTVCSPQWRDQSTRDWPQYSGERPRGVQGYQQEIPGPAH